MKNTVITVALTLLAIITKPKIDNEPINKEFVLHVGVSLCFFALAVYYIIKSLFKKE